MKDKLKDAEWLRREYKAIGAKRIADSLGVTVRTVYNWMNRHGISRTGNDERLPKSFKRLVDDKEALEELYRQHGVSGICSKFGITRSTVYNALNTANIKLTKGISSDTLEILNTPSKLDLAYRELGANGFANQTGINKTTVYNYMYKHGLDRDDNTSSLEKSFECFLIDNEINYVKNNRELLNGLEVDFYIPEHRIAFELNGLYWHSTKFSNKNYHLEKTEEAEKMGIRLFHIFEDDWVRRNNQWKQKVLSVLGMDNRPIIGARSTKVEVVSSTSLRRFFENNHIQGFSGGFYAVRLMDKNGDTVAASIYRKDPSNQNNVILNRYATNCRVIGGLSKIMSHSNKALREMGFSSIVSFADRTLSGGNLYNSTGWKLEAILPPDYRYHFNGKRVRKQNFRREKLKNLLGDDFDPTLSELENTLKNGIYRIYDCGLLKFSFPLSSN